MILHCPGGAYQSSPLRRESTELASAKWYSPCSRLQEPGSYLAHNYDVTFERDYPDIGIIRMRCAGFLSIAGVWKASTDTEMKKHSGSPSRDV